MHRAALLIDGGHLRALAGLAQRDYTNNFIEAFAHGCVDKPEEDLIRILYYDCALYKGTQRRPVSGTMKEFKGDDSWLQDLATRDLFAVRRGQLGFRGWVPRKIPIAGATLSDADFKPKFEQKGVDMRVGLDIATMASVRSVERIILVSADTDMIPAMKHGRKAGLQIVAIQLPMPPAIPLRPQFLAHADYCRPVNWPPSVAAGAALAP